MAKAAYFALIYMRMAAAKITVTLRGEGVATLPWVFPDIAFPRSAKISIENHALSAELPLIFMKGFSCPLLCVFFVRGRSQNTGRS